MNDNIASFSPFQSQKGHIQKFWSPIPQDTLLLWSNKESWGMGSGGWEYNVLVCLEILHQLSSLIVENFLRCYWLKWL